MKAYVCIGGPLDGEFATSDDFLRGHADKFKNEPWYYEGGMYKHLADDYVGYNCAERSSKFASMVWLHKDLSRLPISPRKR